MSIFPDPRKLIARKPVNRFHSRAPSLAPDPEWMSSRASRCWPSQPHLHQRALVLHSQLVTVATTATTARRPTASRARTLVPDLGLGLGRLIVPGGSTTSASALALERSPASPARGVTEALLLVLPLVELPALVPTPVLLPAANHAASCNFNMLF